MQYMGTVSKGQNDLSAFPRKIIQHLSKPSLHPKHWCWRRWSWMVILKPIRSSRTNTKKKEKDVLFIIGHWNAKVGSDAWSNRQVWPWSTKWSKAKANRILPRECTSHSKHLLPTTQEMTLYTQTSPDGQYWNQTDYIFFAVKDGEPLHSQQKQDREQTMTQTMNSLLPNSDLNWRQ